MLNLKLSINRSIAEDAIMKLVGTVIVGKMNGSVIFSPGIKYATGSLKCATTIHIRNKKMARSIIIERTSDNRADASRGMENDPRSNIVVDDAARNSLITVFDVYAIFKIVVEIAVVYYIVCARVEANRS